MVQYHSPQAQRVPIPVSISLEFSSPLPMEIRVARAKMKYVSSGGSPKDKNNENRLNAAQITSEQGVSRTTF
jgi:hypothetical protein